MQDNKTNYKKIFKKGRQKFQSFLGYIETTKEKGVQFASTLKNLGENTGAFLLGIFVWPLIQIKNFTLSLFKIGKSLWEQIKSTFYKTLGILVAIFCVFSTLLLIISIVLHFNPAFIEVISSQFILTGENYNPETLNTLNQLMAQGKIISAGEVYNHVLEYYNTLITILLALLGVFGVISWISIQSKIKHEAELSVDNKFENKDFQCRLEKEVEKTTKEMLSQNTYLTKVAEENIDIIISRLLCNQDFSNKIKEIVQNLKDDKNVELQPLNGVENGDEV